MHPNGPWLAIMEPLREQPESFSESRPVLAQAQHLHGPPWQRKERHNRQKQTVKDIHEGLGTFYGNGAVVQTCPATGYNQTVKAARIIVCLALLTTLLFGEKHFTPPPAAHASTYALHESHKDEKVTIAVEPYSLEDTKRVFKVDYWEHGLYPVRLFISNDSDQTLMLDSLKIEYITAKRDKLQPAANADIYRMLVRPNRADKSHPGMHLPFPVGKKKEAISKDTQEEYESAQFLSVPVTPHATNSGYLFFDMQGEPPEPGAHLYISGIKAGSKELFYFEIPMDKPASAAPSSK